MKVWALGLLIALVPAACGGRTEPLGFTTATSAGGQQPGQGGSFPTPTGGIGGVAGSAGFAGATTNPPPTRHWFAVKQGGGDSAPKLSLVAVGSDDRIEIHALPFGEDAVAAAYGAARLIYTSKGNRFAYSTLTEKSQRFWVVTLSPTSFTTQEVKPLNGAAEGSYAIDEWLSETMFSARKQSEPTTDPDLEPREVEVPYPIYFSLDPTEPLPSVLTAAGGTSPDGTKGLLPTFDEVSRSYTIEVKRVAKPGTTGELLLSMSGVVDWRWVNEAERLLIVLAPWEAASVVVTDFPSSGPALTVDKFGPTEGHIVGWSFGPGNRFLAYYLSLSGRVETRIRDLVKGTESVLRAATGVPNASSVTWVGDNRLMVSNMSDVPPLGVNVATITESTVAQGKTVLAPLSDAYASGALASWTILGDSALLAMRELPTSRVLQVITLTDSTAISTNLLPGVAGTATPVRLLEGSTKASIRTFLVPAVPSYYYLVFNKSKLTRSVCLSDFFGTEYRTFQDVSDTALIARNVLTKEFVWLSLEHEQTGPLISMPLDRSGTDPVFYLPPVWPAN